MASYEKTNGARHPSGQSPRRTSPPSQGDDQPTQRISRRDLAAAYNPPPEVPERNEPTPFEAGGETPFSPKRAHPPREAPQPSQNNAFFSSAPRADHAPAQIKKPASPAKPILPTPQPLPWEPLAQPQPPVSSFPVQPVSPASPVYPTYQAASTPTYYPLTHAAQPPRVDAPRPVQEPVRRAEAYDPFPSVGSQSVYDDLSLPSDVLESLGLEEEAAPPPVAEDDNFVSSPRLKPAHRRRKITSVLPTQPPLQFPASAAAIPSEDASPTSDQTKNYDSQWISKEDTEQVLPSDDDEYESKPPFTPQKASELQSPARSFWDDDPRTRVHPSLSRSSGPSATMPIVTSSPSGEEPISWSEGNEAKPGLFSSLMTSFRRGGPSHPVSDDVKTVFVGDSAVRTRIRPAAILIAALAIILVAILAFGGVKLAQANSGTYPDKVSFMPLPWDQETLVSARGLTQEQALAQLETTRDAFLSQHTIHVEIGAFTADLLPSDLGLHQDTAALLDDLYGQIHEGSLFVRAYRRFLIELGGEQVLPFLWQCDTSVINETALRLADEILAISPPPSISSFDPATQDFIISSSETSIAISAGEIAQALLEYIEKSSFDQSIVLVPGIGSSDQEVMALRARIGTLSEESIVAPGLSTASKTNLAAIALALDGTLIVPGQPWSMMTALESVTTWQPSTVEGDWIDAHPGADIAATAVFNAAIRSGLSVRRVTADVPPIFVDLGMDATLGDGADLTLTNPSDQAVVLRVVALESGLLARIDGVPILENNAYITLESRVLEQLPAGTEQEQKNDSSIVSGEKVTSRPATEGKTVQLNVLTWQDGVAIDNQPYETVTYPPMGELILVGTKPKG